MSKLPNKISILNNIKSIVKVPKFYYFNLKLYKERKFQILKNITKLFKKKIIIRSAHYNEDGSKSNKQSF